MPNQYIASQRSIHVDIIADKRVNDLGDPWFIIGHFRALLKMDNLGRLEADAATLRSMLFPRNPQVTVNKCRAMVKRFHDVGLFFVYTGADGDLFMQSARPSRQKMVGDMQRRSVLPPPPIPGFLQWLQTVRKDQRFMGLSEPETYQELIKALLIPYEDLTKLLPSSSQELSIEEKRREENKKRREIEGKRTGDPLPPVDPTLSPLSLRPSLSSKQQEAEFDHVVDAFHQLVNGDLSPQIATAIRNLLTTLEPTTIVDAMKTGKAQLHRKPDWPYVKAILNNWRDAPPPNHSAHDKDYGPHCPFAYGLLCASNCASPELCKRPDKQRIIDDWKKRQADLSPTDNPQEVQPHDQQA